MTRGGWFRRRTAGDWVVMVSWTIAVVATAIWFLAAARYALPVFDDFCRAALHPTTEFRPADAPAGFWRALSWSYLNWSGRWAGTALGMVVLGGVNIESFYPAVLVVTISIFLVLSLLAARRCFGRHGLLIAGLVWLMWWSATPSLSEVFFWSTTSLEAHAGLIAAALVWSYAASGNLRRWQARVPLIAGAFLVGGLHELAGILFCGCLVWRVLYLAMNNGSGNRQKLRGWLWITSGGVAGTAVSVFAPGNAVRAAMYPDSGALVPSVAAAAAQAITHAKSWLLADPRWWMASLIVLTTVAIHRSQVRDADPGARRDLWWMAAACLTTLAAGFLAPALAQGGEIASRTVAQLFFFVLVCWFAGLSATAHAFLGGAVVSPNVLSVTRAVATCVFCLSVALEGNGRLVRREWSDGTLRRWHDQQLLRMRQLRAGALREAQQVVLPPMSVRSLVLPMVRDSSNPDYAHNLCLEWYYGIPRITTESGGEAGESVLPLAEPPARVAEPSTKVGMPTP